MIDLARRLDRLHGRVRANPILYRFALSTRLLLAMGFIPTGMVKLLGLRFTRLGVDNPVGLLFETLYQGGGFYWRFLGAVQVCADIRGRSIRPTLRSNRSGRREPELCRS